VRETATRQRTSLRKDAARNRHHIIEAARALAHERKPVQLNAVALAADVGVGVGTVYRHFPSPEALIEALAADQFVALIRTAAATPSTQRGLRDFLTIAVTAFLRDDAFAMAVTDPNPITADIQQLRQDLQDGLRALLTRTAADGEEVAKMIQLMIEYAPAPPFDAGTPETAGPEITAMVRAGTQNLNDE
jgi:AcrR family transcriptional regulator